MKYTVYVNSVNCDSTEHSTGREIATTSRHVLLQMSIKAFEGARIWASPTEFLIFTTWNQLFGKGKAVLVQTCSGLDCSKKLRFPYFMTTAQEDGKLVSLTHRQHLRPGNPPGTHFCKRLLRPQGHIAIGRIMSMKNPKDTIWDRTSDLTICSTAP